MAPKDMYVCHHCDVPACVNPNHLFLGTPKDNVQDCIQKGRSARCVRGKANPRRRMANAQKVPYSDYSVIAKLRASGATLSSIAIKYGIRAQSVVKICNRSAEWGLV